jgi:hypothetical protein
MNHKKKNKGENDILSSEFIYGKSLVSGIVVTLVLDHGPEIVANLSEITDDEAFIAATQLLTLGGMQQDVEEDENRLIGPLPFANDKSINILLYMTNVNNKDSEDPRLQEFGSKLAIILLFNVDRSPELRRAIGLIEPYLKRYLHKHVDSVSKITHNFVKEMFHHIEELVSKPQVRSFWYDFSRDEAKLIEYRDPHSVFRDRDLILVDEHTREILALTAPTTSAFDARKMYNLINKANMDLYKNSMKILILESFTEIEPILKKYGIKAI